MKKNRKQKSIVTLKKNGLLKFVKACSIIIASTICILSFFIFHLTLQAKMMIRQRSEESTNVLRTSQITHGLPVRLIIPAINVDAPIESLGLGINGVMDAPKDPDNAGWYNLGPKPGEKGNAVLAGHLDWYNGKTAIFKNLHKLRKGDLISVQTDQGKFITFEVKNIQMYKPDDIAPEIFLRNDGAHLNLVTCGGLWDTSRKMYSERLVIFTDLVGQNADPISI